MKKIAPGSTHFLPSSRRRFHLGLTALLSFAPFVVAACGGSPEVVVDGDDDGDDSSETGGRSNATGGGLNVGGDPNPDPDPEPEPSECGNGELEPGELCDDGNESNGDGCSSDCSEQDPDFDCSVPGEECVDQVVCGNERVEGDESCDDGNESDGDGCAGDCSEVEEGWVCARPGESCVELPVCGNGVRERGEECDDENVESDDGCSGTEVLEEPGCQLEDGFYCPMPGSDCIELVCGDGNRTPDEECDDGEAVPDNGDGCSSTCELENGWRCSGTTCTTTCGDGLRLGAETASDRCDDGNRVSGDGCSAACRVEPFHACTGTPSNCTNTIACGNSVIEPGEVCDPPGTDGCLDGCDSFSPDSGPGSVCGNAVIEPGESCDAPNVGNGCSAGCATESGWTCPQPNTCFRLPSCGDQIVQAGEDCDVGAINTPGCVDCNEQPGWFCYGAGPSICVSSVCGDGTRAVDEECDDDNDVDDDGCTGCVLDSGWVCPTEGEACIPRCGDEILTAGEEECDDGNTTNGDGCTAGCRVELGYSCPDVGEPCEEGACQNGVEEAGEGCDDDNDVSGDGCSATCQDEPVVTVGTTPSVATSCGDGLITGTEQCDDGNTADGDGCSGPCTGPNCGTCTGVQCSCRLEPGFLCDEVEELPDQVKFKVTYRDFRARQDSPGGHPHTKRNDSIPSGTDRGIPGVVCTTANNAVGGACGRLSATGKPVNRKGVSTTVPDYVSAFDLWFADTNPTNIAGTTGTIVIWPNPTPIPAGGDYLILDQVGDTDTYTFYDNTFFPLDGRGYGNTPGQSHNFNFTTELRYYFVYEGGEELQFIGDDDVWVYVNGYLAVDIGGIHGEHTGRVVLGDENGTCNAATENANTLAACTRSAAEIADETDGRFNLTKGNAYEIVLFHAERNPTGSNFKLTLSGFLPPRTYCTPDCGDGQVVGTEVCDDGDDNADGEYGACNTTCSGRAFCGDGTRQTSDEACDDGRNVDFYDFGDASCAPGCVEPPYCGDGSVQGAFEQCDNGGSNSNTAYGSGSCKLDCTLGGYCGDGTVNGSETCDYASPGSTTYGPTSCGYNCQAGPRCGDNVRNGPEECDGTANCGSDCKLEPYCGDGVASEGEECDYAQFASNDYGGCTASCELGPLCGDDGVDSPYEECDEGPGAGNNDGGYGECTDACTLGPRCGDAETQADENEECDNGYNDDAYEYDENSCGSGCNRPPYCGDGVVQGAFELCDAGDDNSDTAYEGCTTSCEWGPYCGDGEPNGTESCDEGLDNVAYSAEPGACGYDCEDAPYCGDGEKNGPEQCDEGDENTGEYGGCTEACTRAPYCGDGEVQKSEGEQCDDGPTGSLGCSVTCRTRIQVPR